jgi:hypothetical protein
MNFKLIRSTIFLLTSISSFVYAHDKPKAKDPEKMKAAKMTHFEGCGKKDKDGKWTELYYNCKRFNGAKFFPEPPCREGFVVVNEALPTDLVSPLHQCIYEL